MEEQTVTTSVDEDIKLPTTLFVEQLESSCMKKQYFDLWSKIFDEYSIFVNNEDLEHVYPALRSYYEYKITQMYDTDFTWNDCCKNNFKLDENLRNKVQHQDNGINLSKLEELLVYMIRRANIPLLMFDNGDGYIIFVKGDRNKLKALKTLNDVRDHSSILKEILYISFSLQGRKALPLNALCGGIVNILQSFKPVDLIKWTSENDNYRCIGKMLKKIPNDHIRRNLIQNDNVIYERSINKQFWNQNIISGAAGMGKSTVLNIIASSLDPKCLIIIFDLNDCVDDLKMDDGEIFNDPINYFFKKMAKKVGQDNNFILEFIYKKQRERNRLIFILDSFEDILYEHSEKLINIFDIMTKDFTGKLIITVDSRNEYLLKRKLQYPSIFRLQDLLAYKKDVERYLKENDILEDKYKDIIPKPFLNNPLYLSMIRNMFNDLKKNDILKFKNIKIIDIYEHFIQNNIEMGKNMDLWNKMAFFFIFDKKYVDELFKDDVPSTLKSNLNFRNEFPHRTIAEYLVAKWICDPKNLDRSKKLISIIFKNFRYSQVYKFIFEIVHSEQKLLEDNLWDVSPLCWTIASCLHEYGDDLKQKLYYLEKEVAKLSVDDLKTELSKCSQIDINQVRFENGDQFLDVACTYQNENLVKTLLQLGFNPNFQNELGRTSLHHACLKNDVTTLKCLLDYGGNPNIVDENGDTPLQLVSKESENVEILKLLLHYKANPNIQNNDNSSTSLHVAVSSKENLEFVRTLLEYGADPNILDSFEHSSLHRACQNGSSELVNLLIDHGADPNIQNSRKWTCLHLATNENNLEAVKVLLPYVTDSNVLDDGQWAPIHIACYHYNNDILKLLLKDGKADPNLQGCWMPLHYSCLADKPNFVEILLEAGANPNLIDNCGRSALHAACYSRNENLIKILLEAGADVHIKTNDDLTTIDLLKKVGTSSMVERIMEYAPSLYGTKEEEFP